jgi:hypothetical protein
MAILQQVRKNQERGDIEETKQQEELVEKMLVKWEKKSKARRICDRGYDNPNLKPPDMDS